MNTMETELPLWVEKQKKATQEDIQWVIDLLTLRGKDERKWASLEILQDLTKYSRRKLQTIANICPRIISGPKGYALADNVTEEEILHCVRMLKHQASQMNARAERIEIEFRKELER